MVFWLFASMAKKHVDQTKSTKLMLKLSKNKRAEKMNKKTLIKDALGALSLFGSLFIALSILT